MAKNKLSGADYLLLLLYVDGNSSIKGAIRLMKMMFLFNKEISSLLKINDNEKTTFSEFFAYDFGPFSKDVYDQVELFKVIEFITIKDIYATEEMIEVDNTEEDIFINEMFAQDKRIKGVDGKYLEYTIIKNGVQYVKQEIIDKKLITQEQISILEQFKKKMNLITPKQILRYVYTKYPEFTANSIIKNEVLGDDL